MQFTPELKTLFKTIKHYPVLNQEAQNALIIKAQNGDVDARNKMILSNMRLVIHIYKKYSSLANVSMSTEDLIQEGTIGLTRAIEKFDVNTGYHFSTYATYWVMQGITRSSANGSRTIRLPVHITERYQKIRKAKNQLSQVLDTEPTVAQISELSGLSEEIVEETTSATRSMVSLDAPIDDGDESKNNRQSSLEDVTADVPAFSETTAEKMTNNDALHDQLMHAMRTLPEEDQEIVLAQFDMGKYAGKDTVELAKIFKMSKAQINQIRVKSLRKLRSRDNLDSLKDFIDP